MPNGHCKCKAYYNLKYDLLKSCTFLWPNIRDLDSNPGNRNRKKLRIIIVTINGFITF